MWEMSNMSDDDDLRGRDLYAALMALKPDGLAETDWALAAGINRGFFTNIKAKPINPRSGTLRKLLKHIGRTEADLYAAADGTPPRAVSDMPPTRSASQADGSITIRQVDLRFGMGPGKDLDEYAEEMPVEFDAGLLRSLTRSPAENLIVVRGDGDSMMPTLINDDMVLVDRAQTILNLQDRIWAVSFDGAGMIKRLRTIGGRRVQVISDNPMVPAQEVGAEDLAIVGRVIWIGRRV